MEQIRERLAWTRRIATNHLRDSQAKQKQLYDKQASMRSFHEGERVLVCSLLFPKQTTREWEGPFTVTRVLWPVNYEVRCEPRPYRLKVLHVNHLKKWHPPDEAVPMVAWLDIQPPPPPPLSVGELPWQPKATEHEQGGVPPIGEDLNDEQQ